MTWLDLAQALAGFVALEDDWDGQGAVAPSPQIIIVARGLLIELRDNTSLPPPSRVAACPMGGILFEWQWPGSYLDAEITPTGEVAWMRENAGAPVEHGVGTQYDKLEWTTLSYEGET